MRLLIDTSIFLEVVLKQVKGGEAQAFLTRATTLDCLVSDYSVHSIGLLFFRRKEHPVFRQMLRDIFVRIGIKPVSLPIADLGLVVEAALKFNLDFDDAYQYSIASKYDLTLISFDGHFDRTDRGRKTPADVLASLSQ